MKKGLILSMLALALIFVLAACGGKSGDQSGSAEPVTGGEGPEQQEEGTVEEQLTGKIVIYSARNEKFVQPLLDKFTEETGVEVVALHEADALKIREEANNVQADVFISNDIGSLEYLRMEGLLEGLEPAGVETIDEKFRADDNSWIALSARTRGFIYNKDMITEEEMPKSVEDLMDSKWAGQFMITRGGNGSMVAHISSIRNEWGDEKTKEWIAAVKENAGAITNGHGDIRKAVGAGEFAFGLVNNYYYHQQLEEPTDNNVGFIYPDQGDGQMGAVINGAGVGLVAGSPNEANAKAFIEWLLKPENQLAFSFESLEVPINTELEPKSDAAVKISDIKVQSMPLKDLGQYFADTKALIEQSGLDLELK